MSHNIMQNSRPKMDDATQIPFTTPIRPRPMPVWGVCEYKTISTDTICEDNGNLMIFKYLKLTLNLFLTQGAFNALASCAFSAEIAFDCLQPIDVGNV